MKDIFKIKNRFSSFKILAGVLLVFTASCDLDEEVISFRTDSNFYQNQDELNSGVIATYSGLSDVNFSEWSVTELRSDNTFIDPRRSPESDFTAFSLDRMSVETNNSISQTYYAACYKVIALANRVIANIDVAEDENLRNQFEGEARFLRALMHFNLTRLYGSIIISDQIFTGQEGLQLARLPQTEVYDFIIQDLTNAIELLPEQYEQSQFGRATSIAARTLLGKVHLTTSPRDLEAAITQLEFVRDQSDRSLSSSYDAIFDADNELNDEIIFAVRYESGLVGLGNPLPNEFAPRNSLGAVVFGDGDSQNVPTEQMSAAYGDMDVRKESSMADSFETNASTEEEPVIELTKFILKYNAEFSAFEDAPTDFPILRYADVLLMLSEAYVDARTIPEALVELNQVRTRAGLPALTETDTPSAFAFRLALEEERRVEFAFENHRWFDLVRTGRAIAVMNQHFATEPDYNDPDDPDRGTGPIVDFQLLLPIPQREINNNPNLAQNIGY